MLIKVATALVVLVALSSAVHAVSHGVDLSTLASEYVPKHIKNRALITSFLLKIPQLG